MIAISFKTVANVDHASVSYNIVLYTALYSQVIYSPGSPPAIFITTAYNKQKNSTIWILFPTAFELDVVRGYTSEETTKIHCRIVATQNFERSVMNSGLIDGRVVR